MVRKSRRNLLKGLAVTAPAVWTAPLVKSVILPAHAQTSPCSPFLSCSTDDPSAINTPDGTNLTGSGSDWGWNWEPGDQEDETYAAAIAGLEAEACPGTDVTISIVGGNTENATVGTGGNPLTVTANASGVASFTEIVEVAFGNPLGSAETIFFTLRFSSDEDTCDIPFCFTEFEPGACSAPGP